MKLKQCIVGLVVGTYIFSASILAHKSGFCADAVSCQHSDTITYHRDEQVSAHRRFSDARTNI